MTELNKEMGLNEALEATGQLLHQFRGIVKLNEVMKMAAKLESFLSESNDKKKNIEGVIANLEAQKTKLQDDANLQSVEIEKEMAQKIENFNKDILAKEEEHKMKLSVLQGSFDKESGEIQVAINDLKTKKATIEAESRGLVDKHKKKLVELENEVAKEEAKLEATKKALEEIKSKI